MITLEQFRQKVRENEFEFLMNHVLLTQEAAHVSELDIQHLKSAVAEKFALSMEMIAVWIVGSAKLGFSLVEKRRANITLPRYRLFSQDSDIDVAIVSSSLFDLIWDELSTYSHRAVRFPWDSGSLGDYLVCGWLRPDHFPIETRLRRCDDWWDLFRSLSADNRYGRRKVRGGLFHSVEHLKRYQQRALNECLSAERVLL